eukprot:4396452-Prymnesium_polylepis.1
MAIRSHSHTFFSLHCNTHTNRPRGYPTYGEWTKPTSEMRAVQSIAGSLNDTYPVPEAPQSRVTLEYRLMAHHRP